MMRNTQFVSPAILLAVSVFLVSGIELLASDIPEIIVTPSAVGEVSFPHSFHFDDLGLDCAECHHETHAVELGMPHEEYFDDFWIDCGICHQEGGTPAASQSCSVCHDVPTAPISDETLSSKVVVHQSCWNCHDVGTGEDASRSCGACHQSQVTSS